MIGEDIHTTWYEWTMKWTIENSIQWENMERSDMLLAASISLWQDEENPADSGVEESRPLLADFLKIAEPEKAESSSADAWENVERSDLLLAASISLRQDEEDPADSEMEESRPLLADFLKIAEPEKAESSSADARDVASRVLAAAKGAKDALQQR